jgi:hypothetical protein
MRTTLCRLFTGVLAGAALFVQPLTVVAAPAAGAQLPDWDAAKPKPKPADLPDWDAAKPKPKDPKKPKKPRGEKPAGATPTETPAEAPPEEAPPAETPTETAPAEATPTETAPAVETPAPVVETPTPVVEGPEPAPAVDTGSSKDAQRTAKREIVAGAAILGLGIGGLGMMGAGFAIRGNKNATEEEYDRGVTILSAGAIIGTIGTIMGLALLGDGIKDRKAARPKAQARVLPTFGGLAISGRF